MERRWDGLKARPHGVAVAAGFQPAD